MNAVAPLFTYAGLAALALAMTRHHRTVFGRDIAPQRRLVLRIAGWLLLALSIAAAVRASRPEIGVVVWFSTAAVAGFILTILLAYKPRLWPLPLAFLLLFAACTK